MSEELKKEKESLSNLHYNKELAEKLDKFNEILNSDPIENWMKEHPSATAKDNSGKTVKARYYPIDKVEWLMIRIFQDIKYEILREGIMGHSLYVVVRVHYIHPVTGEWRYQDGIGAQKIQIKSQMAFSIENMNPAAIQMALPSAESYAVKDACDKLGRFFGRDVNRSNTLEFAGAYSSESKSGDKISKESDRLLKLISSSTSKEKLRLLFRDLQTPLERDAYDKKMSSLDK